MTKTFGAIAASAGLMLLLAGCQKADAPMPQTSSPGTSSTSGASVTSSSSSVAAPPSALPPSDAAIKPEPPPPATKTSDADGPTQATPKELSKKEESANMPLAGQVNNHSTPATVNEKK